MKRIILSAFLLLSVVSVMNAQEFSKHTLGLRLGDNDGFGGEISYQKGLTNENRIEIDLGWRNSKDVDAFKLTGVYQWVWQLEGNFNWYAGAGGGLGTWNFNKLGVKENGTFVFVAGNLGIEYNFDIPLQISLDIRPEIYLVNDGFKEDDWGPDVALGIRYRF